MATAIGTFGLYLSNSIRINDCHLIPRQFQLLYMCAFFLNQDWALSTSEFYFKAIVELVSWTSPHNLMVDHRVYVLIA